MCPVILCGGSGTRLWPLMKQKPFYNFFGQNNLLSISLNRLKKFEPIFLISNKNFKTDIENTLKNKKYKTKVIYEPESKNTAASIALACCLLSKKKKKSKEIIGIFPSDHFIGQEQKFQKYLSIGIQAAQEENQLITFGIPPRSPSPSYGYIKTGGVYKQIHKISIKKGKRFLEKPNVSKSSTLLRKGYLWNSGIFISPLHLLIRYFEMFLPDLWEKILRLESHSIQSVYKHLKPVSFDKGIMEKISQYLCLPCDMDWADIGSWDHISDWSQEFPEKLNNKAKIYEKDSKNNLVFSTEDKLIGLIGIKNKLIINSERGLLISEKGKSEDVRYIRAKLEKQKIKWIKKPWGAYRTITKKDSLKFKELKIKAGHQLSYQSHKKRKEHWIVTKGSVEAIVEGQTNKLQTNDHFFVDQKIKHRLKNPTKQNALLLEIQMGNYLEEDDIIRYEDDYGRI